MTIFITVTITAAVGTSSSSASVIVFVTKGAVTAAVVGGYIRTASLDKILTLDASISSDAAVSPDLPSTLAYKVVLGLVHGIRTELVLRVRLMFDYP
jgi:hypothetical protein